MKISLLAKVCEILSNLELCNKTCDCDAVDQILLLLKLSECERKSPSMQTGRWNNQKEKLI
jgi:hypothetical protein